MSLAQQPEFSPLASPFQKKHAHYIPVLDAMAAERYTSTLRSKFAAMNKKQKKEMYDLMIQTVSILMNKASSKNRKNYSRIEQTNFLKTAMIYQKMKVEFGRELQ